jgi:molecular chaperone GrpE
MVIVPGAVSHDENLSSEAAATTNTEATETPGAKEQASAVDPLAEAESKLAAMKDQLLRTAADFDNFRKRSRREVEDALAAGKESILKDLLPVFDNLERAVSLSGSATDLASFVSGIDMVMKQFVEALKRGGIERIEAKGQAFDPTVHEAIQQIETDDVPAGAVAAEVQTGYRFANKLIRPALVVVAKPKTSPAPDAESEQVH